MNKGVGGRQVVIHNCSKRKSGPRTNLFLLPKQPELGRAARTLEWCLFLGGLAAFAVAGLRCLGVLWLPGESDGGRGADREGRGALEGSGAAILTLNAADGSGPTACDTSPVPLHRHQVPVVDD